MIPLRRRIITTNLKTTSKITINYDIKNRNKKGTAVEKNKLNKLKDEKKAKLSFQNFSIHVAVLFMIGFIFRAYHFSFPNTITDSELVIAQQINWSLNGKFFIGSIPPVTIMIHTIIAKLLGYGGNEPILFSGQHITEFPLAQLRLVSILLNSLTIPSSYMLVRALNHNHLTAFFTAFLLTFENVWSFFSYQNNEYLSIKKSCITGILIGIALCTKWQTILLVLSIWSISLFKGYKNICDPYASLSTIVKNSCIQFLSLVFIPSVIYILIFQSHFYMVPRSGDHDLFLDSSIKFSLIGNEFNPTQQVVTYGSKVILKHVGTNNGYLHSHSKNYTSGSKQQQVTVYPFEDLNNIWVIRKPGSALLNATSKIEYLKNNDVIELEHITTSRKLYSHHFNPPIHHSEDYHEVTANDNSLIKENKSKWRIRIITQDENYDAQSFDPISTLTTRFRLLHHSGCYLSSHYQPLFIKDGAQQEVTCMNSAKPSVSSWVFEYAYNEYAREKTPNIQYPKPSFNQKLSGSSQWTKQQCNDIGLGIPNCYKYPPSNGFQDLLVPTSLKNQLSSETASLVADENHLIVETEVDIPLPGKIKLFKYKRGEEANARHKINQIQSKAFKKASKTAYGARRFMRAKETILPV
ncbi:hypothetical protein BJ944DRAFT_288919 [Cunninghamella echinulata]|nr:hypothetical protein BJ944DRAFT_288919 [Cunninghamella echinulata]